MNRFPKKQRIKTSSEFNVVFNEGTKFVCPEFVALSNGTTKLHPRLGVVVSKKVGNAVVRNKIKRSFREIFRQFSKRENLHQRDFIFIARNSVRKLSFGELSLAVSKSFQWFERKLT